MAGCAVLSGGQHHIFKEAQLSEQQGGWGTQSTLEVSMNEMRAAFVFIFRLGFAIGYERTSAEFLSCGLVPATRTAPLRGLFGRVRIFFHNISEDAKGMHRSEGT